MPDGTYLVLSGPPCSGKSTLGRWLAREFRVPFFPRESLTDTLFQELGWSGRRWRWRIRVASYRLFYLSIGFLMQQRKPFIIASCFDQRTPERHSDILRALHRRYRVRPIQLYCWARFEDLARRHGKRVRHQERHPGWDDQGLVLKKFFDDILRGAYPPLALAGPLVTIDNSGHWKLDRRSVVRRVLSAAKP